MKHFVDICMTTTNDAIAIYTRIGTIITAMTAMHMINIMIAMIAMLKTTMMTRISGGIDIVTTRIA